MKKIASKIIDFNGGTTAVAKVCGLRPQAVSRWRRFGIPKAWMKFINAGGLKKPLPEKEAREQPEMEGRRLGAGK